MGGARKKKIVQVAAAVEVDDPDAEERKSDGSASDASGYASDYKTEDVSAIVDDDETAGGFENLLDGQQLLERGHPIERIVRIEFGGSAVQPTSTPLRFFVKFRGLSYNHATWVFKSRLESDPSSKALLTRFMKKYSPDDEDPWDDRCLQIERIIDHDKDVGQVLVKWQTLPYAESTWEAISFLKRHINCAEVQTFVDDYGARNTVPSLHQLTRVDRPANADGFQKLELSPIFNDGLEQGLELRPYQVDGLNWLIFNWMSHRNVILSDEMGLGKTAQTVSMVHHLLSNYNDRGPFLIVGPLSAVPHFAREFERFTNMQVVLYKDDNVSRQLQRLKEFHFHDENGEPVYKDKQGRPIFKFNVLITTYEILRSDLSELRQINWRLVCIDEAHRLKNNDSKTTSSMRELKTEFTLLLTGTPLQNNLEELWTLLNICDRVRFPSKDEFMQQFGGDSKSGEGAGGMDAAAVTELHEVIRPYILRRLKEDVEKSLKPKEETIVNVELTSLQRNVYRQIYENNGTLLVKGPKGAQAVSLRNVVIQLRKVCNHPWLIDGVEEQMLGIASMLPQLMDRDPTCPKNELVNRALSTLEPGKYREKLIFSSGKMVLLDKLLPRLLQRGSKVIIFSQMVAMLDLIADYLNISGYSFQRLDGRHRGVVRQIAIDKFNSDAECFVFLASTRAGGVGINLTAADTVIIYDSDWNPQNDVQAQARCHRIGQTKDVKIYRLVTRNTYEAEMFDRASKKLGLDRAVLARIESAVAASSAENAKMMDRLLRHGAYALFQDADEADKFCEEDIDQILAKRARVLTEEAGERSSEFSKAHFQVNETEEQKDIEFMIESEDPELWNKLGIRDNAHEKSMIWTKRDRKQTKLFSAAAEEVGFASSSSDSDGDDEKSASTK
jgi:SNF2 family DNA or RNA helicase